ncbi:phosphogluconate dehydratase [Endozoicomonas numazuensis]|uniref:Phosphogluconate dehydratase n=1 Tax=Endozoicomonas numazuensis TaxID=1137799 RepID=A0A081NEW9_9GAMM|nr:phosphogluconate dehydratase [Endozoicomonas numazuensis]KEQ16992.1 phosphogluconate dehydratase [Endozoicomonas numazuensis]
MNSVIEKVTRRIAERSRKIRQSYIQRMKQQASNGKVRTSLSCGNLAHAVAACGSEQKDRILNFTTANVAIVSAYNDMLSAHEPYREYPTKIKQALNAMGHSAQVAGGVPAMCDGVTQGQPGMDLSLYSRDVIAQSVAVSLSHNTFDATLLLGVCDKIAPGQLIGALSFGHLPTAFIPSGPMPTGITNDEKVKVRQQYVAGEVGQEALQKMECNAYHSPGTCTFYGTANTNQLVFESMGLMLPGSAFIPPGSALRDALIAEASVSIASQTTDAPAYRPLWQVVDERSLVNGLVALLASGGSTNHSIHMIAVARAAGLILTWDDFEELSQAVPLLTRVYPNGKADINQFQQAGGVPVLLSELAKRGLLNMDAIPCYGTMENYLQSPELVDGKLIWQDSGVSRDAEVIVSPGQVFAKTGGLKVLSGNLGRAVIKISAVAEEHWVTTAPAIVFDSQYDVADAYKRGELNKDAIIVVRFNGPSANGMPELHMLMPILGNLQKAGHQVALVTDGRLSGASGKIPAAIHVTPEAAKGGALAFIENGDLITVDAREGSISVDTVLSERNGSHPDLTLQHFGCGRELFNGFRQLISSAEQGASILFPGDHQ